MLTDIFILRLSTDVEMVLTRCEMHVLWQDQAMMSCLDQEIFGLCACNHGNPSTIGMMEGFMMKTEATLLCTALLSMLLLSVEPGTQHRFIKTHLTEMTEQK